MIIFPHYVSAIIGALKNAGFLAYAVGGCIRDSLLGIEPNDWDITTSALPDEVIGALSARGFDVRAGAGLKHGTVTVIVREDGGVFACEVTTFRRDGEYTDQRRPDSVEFVTAVEEDLSRRDFTINAMASDGGETVDPFGGRADLRDRLIRSVGDARTRFSEDALRILRGLRFAARFGFAIEADTAAAMRELCATVRAVSRERIASELAGILSAAYATEVLREFGDVIGGALGLDVTAENAGLIGESSDTAVRFALYFGEESPALARSLKMSAEFIRRADSLIAAAEMDVPRERADVMRLMRGYPKDYEIMLEYAGIARGERELFARIARTAEEIVRSGDCYTLSALAVGGREMIAVGFRGRAIGDALEHLLELVCRGSVANDADELIAAAEKLYKEGGSDVFE